MTPEEVGGMSETTKVMLTQIYNEVRGVRDDQKDIGKEVANHGARIEPLEADVKALESRIVGNGGEGLERKVDSIATSIEWLLSNSEEKEQTTRQRLQTWAIMVTQFAALVIVLLKALTGTM